MKTIYDIYDKSKIPTLPRALFYGRIIVVFTQADCEKAVSYLLKQKILGIDTETRPSFKRGVMHQVALLQVSTYDTCFLFRLNMTDINPPIRRLLEDTTVAKVGLSLQDDIRMLAKRAEFTPGWYIELQHEILALGIKDMSLQKIYANLFGEKICKNQQLSNWEADTLSEAQQRYAATDAWACLRIYEEILRLKREDDYILEMAETSSALTALQA